VPVEEREGKVKEEQAGKNKTKTAQVIQDCERGESSKWVLRGVRAAATNNQHKERNQTDKPEHENCVQETSHSPV